MDGWIVLHVNYRLLNPGPAFQHKGIRANNNSLSESMSSEICVLRIYSICMHIIQLNLGKPYIFLLSFVLLMLCHLTILCEKVNELIDCLYQRQMF